MRKVFKPKYGDVYYYCYGNVGVNLGVSSTKWYGYVADYANLICGNCFKTFDEAVEQRDSLCHRLEVEE